MVEQISGKYDWSGKKLLLVEDEDTNMEYLQIILKPTGAELVPAYNGKEVREFYPVLEQFHLVMMDVRLPDTSGWELAAEIKKLRPDLPVIAQTAYAMAADKQQSEAVGCDDYISKPVNKNVLLKLISGYLS